MKISEDDPLFLVLLIIEVVLADALQKQTAALDPILEQIKKQREELISSGEEAMTMIEGCAQREVASLMQSMRDAAFKALENASTIADDRYGDLIRSLDDAVSKAETQVGELVTKLHEAVKKADGRDRRLRVLTEHDIQWLSLRPAIASRGSGSRSWAQAFWNRVRRILK
ncbi:hypothetical protein [Paraburkholderia sp. GAS42]|uniref:hypothetical protein n=1 Tax=Paraburkholderia sp. GAS42 TaxID=3035135 RepID=UPI003D1E91FF